jgi:hypothetical protein
MAFRLEDGIPKALGLRKVLFMESVFGKGLLLKHPWIIGLHGKDRRCIDTMYRVGNWNFTFYFL